MKSPARDKMLLAALERLETLQKQEAFDPVNLASKPTAAQQEVLRDFNSVKIQVIRAGNQSGKSQTCARVLTWVMTETHPHWTRPADWGNETLLALVAGRTGRQIEESLLPKLKSYLEPNTYKEVRVGNMIQRLELSNGNRIIFQSLENPNIARERIQSYVAHIVWVDELPPTVDIMNELMVRIQARNGHLLASFTPLVRNVKVQKFVDGLNEHGAKVYRFKMLDNPLYSDPERQREIIASFAHLPEHVRNARLYGDWMSEDNAVYYFDYATMMSSLPPTYSRAWPHVESVDPASSSALGYTLWACDPQTNIWYNVKAEYVKGIFVPTEIVAAVRSLSDGYNIIRRVSDTEPWFVQQASVMGVTYISVHKKMDRKLSMIKAFQEQLGSKVKLTEYSSLLVDELTDMRWSESQDNKIISSNHYHLHDSAVYFVDNQPKIDHVVSPNTSWEDQLWKSHVKRKETEHNNKIRVLKNYLRRGGKHNAKYG